MLNVIYISYVLTVGHKSDIATKIERSPFLNINMYINHRIGLETQGTNDKSDGDEIDNSPPKPVPYQRWEFTLCNVMHERILGENYLLSGKKTNSSTVFKVRLGEWKTMVCDLVGLRYLDFTKVKREERWNEFNSRMLRDHVPSILSADYTDEHQARVELLLKFFKDANDSLTVKGVAEVVQSEIEKMGNINFSNASDAEMFDFEKLIRRATINILIHVFLGDYLSKSEPNAELIYEWRKQCINPTLVNSLLSLFGKREKFLTGNVFEMLINTVNLKELKVTAGLNDTELEIMLSEIAYLVLVVAAGGVKDILMSCLLYYVRLSAKDKRLLKEDANSFFEASNTSIEGILPTLKHIEAFCTEVSRLHPPVAKSYRRAKIDFVLPSTSGNFQIHAGDFLCAHHFMAQRDPNLFQYPDRFILHRVAEGETTGNFTYGALFSEDPSSKDYLSIAQSMTDTIRKVFVLFLTKCTIIPTNIPVYTACNYENPEITIQPLKVLRFHYER